MKNKTRLLIVFAIIMFLPLFYTFGCTSPADKITAEFSKTEFSIDLDDENSTSQYFDVRVNGLSNGMSSNLEFSYEPEGVVRIENPVEKENNLVRWIKFIRR